MTDASSDRVEQQVVDAVRANQSAVLDAVRSWADSVQRLIPEMPANPVTGALPDPSELVDRAYDFASELLKAQREFTHELLRATSRTPSEGPTGS
jgi:hypothetical protein